MARAHGDVLEVQRGSFEELVNPRAVPPGILHAVAPLRVRAGLLLVIEEPGNSLETNGDTLHTSHFRQCHALPSLQSLFDAS